ncbi:LytR C-terminal domain-containing protein [Pseudonocardia sp.]|uniref:LytR C-terminal domain-containing protein n=1 Tax=Pseudonocardia sp. TaxID=60912 RepID=UPI003D11FA88
MTTPGSPGGSPLRIGGFALIGVGIVAGVIGLATTALGNGNGADGGTNAAAPTSATAPAEPGPGATPTDGSVPLPSFGPTGNIGAPPTTEPGAGGAGAAGGAGGTGGTGSGAAAGGGVVSPDTLKAPVRVYNNSTIGGLAERARTDFESAGWNVTEARNYSDGIIPTSTVYYRPGTAEQGAADALARQFGMRSEPRFSGIEDATPGIIVIVTKDYQQR